MIRLSSNHFLDKSHRDYNFFGKIKVPTFAGILGEQLPAQNDSETVLLVLFWRNNVFIFAEDGAHDEPCEICLANHVFNLQVHGQVHSPNHADNLTVDLLDTLPAITRLSLLQILSRALKYNTSEQSKIYCLDYSTGVANKYPLLMDIDCPNHESKKSSVPVLATDSQLLTKIRDTNRTRIASSKQLVSQYVTPIGLFSGSLMDVDTPLSSYQVNVPLTSGGNEPGIGRATSFEVAHATSILEALERYSGLRNGGRKNFVVAPFNSVSNSAVDPRNHGIHAEWQYRIPNFPFKQFDPNTPIPWVESLDLSTGKTKLISADAAFWGQFPDKHKRLFYDCSNGTALGNSPEEATLYALLELIERDSFLLAWYLRLKLPSIKVDSKTSLLYRVIQKVMLCTNFSVSLFYARMDTKIPVVLALAKNRSNKGPQTFISAGAGLSVEDAALSAVKEVSGIIPISLQTYKKSLDHALWLSHNLSKTKTMMDHSLLGSLESSKEWFSFLDSECNNSLSIHDFQSTSLSNSKLNIAEDLSLVVKSLISIGIKPYIVDLSTPEDLAMGFHVIRAVAPGLIPMTFGHNNRRLEGLPRLKHPEYLPYLSLKGDKDIYSVPPHPFP